jgi:hypothetical protein
MGGVEAARMLINQPVSEGFLRLREMGCLDLSLESLIDGEPDFIRSLLKRSWHFARGALPG